MPWPRIPVQFRGERISRSFAGPQRVYALGRHCFYGPVCERLIRRRGDCADGDNAKTEDQNRFLHTALLLVHRVTRKLSPCFAAGSLIWRPFSIPVSRLMPTGVPSHGHRTHRHTAETAPQGALDLESVSFIQGDRRRIGGNNGQLHAFNRVLLRPVEYELNKRRPDPDPAPLRIDTDIQLENPVTLRRRVAAAYGGPASSPLHSATNIRNNPSPDGAPITDRRSSTPVTGSKPETTIKGSLRPSCCTSAANEAASASVASRMIGMSDRGSFIFGDIFNSPFGAPGNPPIPPQSPGCHMQ